VQRLPGVVDAASSKAVPLRLSGFSIARLWLPNQPPEPQNARAADWNLVTSGYFETLRTPILMGRGFTESDRLAATEVAIVNETLARRLWPGQDPVGRTLLYGPPNARRPLQIVGVARDAKYRSLGEQPRPFIYVPLAQHYNSELWLMMRTSGPSAIPALRALLRDMDPNLPLVQATTLEDATAFGLLPSRIAAWLAGMVGIIGVLLAALGIYGLTAYSVSQRTREIGVRVALGASRIGILRMVLRQATAITGAGLLLGLALALLATRLLTSLLFGVAPIDPMSFAGGAALLTALALLAALIPATRATRVNPMLSLRAE